MSYANPRIQPHHTVQDILYTMSEGNPGALTAMMLIIMEGPQIDPQDAFGGLGTILHFDTADIYGSDIYVYFNEVCNCNTTTAVGLMRAVQLGIINESEIKQMISDCQNYMQPDDNRIAVLMDAVREQLQEFRR